jgi:hypothetical protein
MRSCRACDFEICPDCAAARRPVMAFPSPLQVARARGAAQLTEYLQTICPADDDEHAAMQHPVGPPEPPASAAPAAATTAAAAAAGGGTTAAGKKPKHQTRRYSAVAAVKVLAGFTALPAKDKPHGQAQQSQAQATGASSIAGPARSGAAHSQQKNATPDSAATPAAAPEREITSRDNPRSCLTFFQERIAAVTPRRATRQQRRGLAHLAEPS